VANAFSPLPTCPIREHRYHAPLLPQALRGSYALQARRGYVVKACEVIIARVNLAVRQMPGRRWSYGLAQGRGSQGMREDRVRENQTLATITFQNYFRM